MRGDYAAGDRVQVRDNPHMAKARIVGKAGTVVEARRAFVVVALDEPARPGPYALFYDEVIRTAPGGDSA